MCDYSVIIIDYYFLTEKSYKSFKNLRQKYRICFKQVKIFAFYYSKDSASHYILSLV